MMLARDLNAYWANGLPKIQGWVALELLDPLKCIARAQEEARVTGNVAEIGVFRGKFLITMAHMTKPGEHCVAIDIFDDQNKNIDGSSPGAPGPILLENYQKFAPSDCPMHTIKADSLAMTVAQRIDICREHGPFRLFSVDGGHTCEHALNDLLFAQDALAEGGVIALDDVYHRHWPGVTEALGKFYSQYVPRIVPFYSGYNKLFLVSCTYHKHFLRHVRAHLSERPATRMVRMFGADVLAVI